MPTRMGCAHRCSGKSRGGKGNPLIFGSVVKVTKAELSCKNNGNEVVGGGPSNHHRLGCAQSGNGGKKIGGGRKGSKRSFGGWEEVRKAQGEGASKQGESVEGH